MCLIDLDTFIKINQEEYEEVAYRRLCVRQTEEEEQQGLYKGVRMELLEGYLNSLLGKKY